MKLFRLSFIIGLMCLSLQGLCDEPLTWEDCLKEAGDHNAALITVKESLQRAEAQVSSGYAPFLPQLSGTIGYTRSSSSGSPSLGSGGGGGGTPGLLGSSGSTQQQYSVGLTSTLNVFNGFQDEAKLNQAKANLESQKAMLQAQKATLNQDLKKAFAQLVYAQEALSLLKEIEERRKDNFDLVGMKFQGGRENKGSFLRSKASYRQAQFDVSQAKRNLRVSQKQLARLLGRNLLDPLSVKGNLTTRPLPSDDLNFRELAKETPQAVQSHSDLKVADASVSKAYGAFLPSLALTGSTYKLGTDTTLNSSRWSAGITLSIPLFQWGNFTEVGGAKADQRKAEATVRNSEEQAGVKLEETFAALANAVERVDVQQETVSAASIRSEISRNQYSTGTVSYTDWDLIENDLITQQQNLLSLKRDAVIAEANWEQALGKGEFP